MTTLVWDGRELVCDSYFLWQETRALWGTASPVSAALTSGVDFTWSGEPIQVIGTVGHPQVLRHLQQLAEQLGQPLDLNSAPLYAPWAAVAMPFAMLVVTPSQVARVVADPTRKPYGPDIHIQAYSRTSIHLLGSGQGLVPESLLRAGLPARAAVSVVCRLKHLAGDSLNVWDGVAIHQDIAPMGLLRSLWAVVRTCGRACVA